MTIGSVVPDRTFALENTLIWYEEIRTRNGIKLNPNRKKKPNIKK
jgi:hypothetical protein